MGCWDSYKAGEYYFKHIFDWVVKEILTNNFLGDKMLFCSLSIEYNVDIPEVSEIMNVQMHRG
jgi:hypothetical protein